MLVQRIDDEEEGVDKSVNNSARNLNVAAKRPRFHAFHSETHLLNEQSPGGAGGDQMASFQSLAVERRECNKIGFLAVVGDDANARPTGVRNISTLNGKQLGASSPSK